MARVDQTTEVRRALAGLLFGIAYVALSLSIGGFLLQRTAFDPDRTAASADSVLQDRRIRDEVVGLVAEETAPQLGVSTAEVKAGIDLLLDDPATAGPMSRQLAEVLKDAHARLIGQQDEPVVITPQQMREIVRNDLVLAMDPVLLPVPQVSILERIDGVLSWLVPVGAALAVVFAVAGLTTHPERSALLRSLGFGLLLLAVLVLGLGYLVPRFLVPSLSDNVWARVPTRLAADVLPVVIGLTLVLGGGGIALLASSGIIRRRRRWSAPVSTYRYAEDRRWT